MIRPRAWSAALVLVLAACSGGGSADAPSGTPSGTPSDTVGRAAQEVRLAGSARVEAWFTSPGTTIGVDPALDDALVALIGAATVSVDVAAYNFDRQNVIDALVAAHSRGVEVRFVGDGDLASDPGYLQLQAAGVPTSLRPAGNAIMHHKFVLVDGAFVWTGSTNLSDNDILLNNNNSVVVESAALAAAYRAEFDEMMVHGRFGRSKLDVTSGSVVTASGVNVEYFFGPKDGLMARVLERVDTAQRSVHAMIFTFTRTDLRSRLIARQSAGAGVYAIFDTLQASGAYSQDEALAAAGVPTWLDGNRNGSGGGLLHHKVLILDGDAADSDPMVITGSFNWTASGDQDNDENLLVLHSAELARAYLRQFCALRGTATPHPGWTGSSAAGCGGRVILNEALPNPVGTDLGKEYVELANVGFSPVDVGGWTLRSGGRTRHSFQAGFVIPAGGVNVVFDRGAHGEPFAVLSSTGSLALANTAGSVTLNDASGGVRDALSWSSTRSGVSKNRSPDVTVDAAVADHDSVSFALGSQSPGLHADGMSFEGVGGVAAAARPLVGELLITQFATRGSSSASDEFVEIYNDAGHALSIEGVQLQYQPSSCSGWVDRHRVPSGVVLAPGQFYLLTGTGYVVPGSGPAGEGTLTSGLADSGLLRVLDGAAALDTAAYGTGLACMGEGGTAAPNHGTSANATSVARRPWSAGTPYSLATPAQDTDVNSADFAVRSARSPRNGATITPSH